MTPEELQKRLEEHRKREGPLAPKKLAKRMAEHCRRKKKKANGELQNKIGMYIELHGSLKSSACVMHWQLE